MKLDCRISWSQNECFVSCLGSMEDYSKLPSAIERAKEEEKLKRAREDAEKLAAAQVNYGARVFRERCHVV